MRLTELILLGFLTLSGCKKNDSHSFTPATPTNTVNVKIDTDTALKDTVTYLALGDSYTYGQSVPQADGFPYQLTAQLQTNKLKAGMPRVLARTGWTTGDLIAAIPTANLDAKYSFVTLLIGVNNQYQNYDPEGYRKDFDQLVNAAISFARGGATHVYVLSIPDYSVTPYAKDSNTAKIAQELAVYNAINQGESARLRVNYIDITPSSQAAANDASLLANDGLHPSAKMYAMWVKQLLPQVLAGLK